MRLRIDACGRPVIPQVLRGGAGVTPGAAVDATLRDGRIDLEAPPAAVLLERRGRVWVAVPEVATPSPCVEGVRPTVEELPEAATPYDHR